VPERERHRPVDDDSAIHTSKAFKLTHPAPETFDTRFNLHNVAGIHGPPVAHPLDAHEERKLVAVLRLPQNQDCTYLRHAFGQDRRRQRRRFPGMMSEVALVERDVLDADDSLVGFQLSDAIDQQEWKAVRQNAFDGAGVQRQNQGFQEAFSIIRSPRDQS